MHILIRQVICKILIRDIVQHTNRIIYVLLRSFTIPVCFIFRGNVYDSIIYMIVKILFRSLLYVIYISQSYLIFRNLMWIIYFIDVLKQSGVFVIQSPINL